jgi:hypothetical protein
MGRPFTGSLATICASGTKRDIDFTLDITFPDASVFHYATSPLTAVHGFNYTNALEDVGEQRQTIEGPVDRVAIGLQNKDRVLSQHLAVNWQIWRTANAVLGRYYYQINAAGQRTGTNVWMQMFQGAVQKPNADDLKMTFDLIPDTTSPGQIICNRTEAANCGFRFKDALTCSYSGGLTTCNHQLKSTGGCDGRNNSQHFGGTEHRYQPDTSVPGTGGAIDPPFHPPTCPRIDQFVRVRGDGDVPITKMAGFVTEDDWLWHPLLRRFFKVRHAELVRDQPIWECVTSNGAVGYSSFRHPVIRNVSDASGLAVSRINAGQSVLTDIELQSQKAFVAYSADTKARGDVVRFEMDTDIEAEKIYCYGDSPKKMIDCHNNKGIEP